MNNLCLTLSSPGTSTTSTAPCHTRHKVTTITAVTTPTHYISKSPLHLAGCGVLRLVLLYRHLSLPVLPVDQLWREQYITMTKDLRLGHPTMQAGSYANTVRRGWYMYLQKKESLARIAESKEAYVFPFPSPPSTQQPQQNCNTRESDTSSSSS